MNTATNPFTLRLVLLMAASYFSLSSPAFADEEFYGTVETRPTENRGVWAISGQQLEVTDTTKFDTDNGPPVVGACVEVDHDNGVVEEIETVNPSLCGRK